MLNDLLEEKNALLRVARLRDITEDWDKALREYQALEAKFPLDPFILEPLARVQGKLGQKEARVRTLVRAAEAYRDLGMPRKAEQLEEKLLRTA